jgi:formate transporter FocA
MADANLQPSLDSLMPADMAAKAEAIGVKKARLDFWSTFVLAVLAGAFISLGAIFATTVSAGSSALPYGVARLLAGTVFSLGLILVVVGGAELFTGNTLIVMAWAGGKVTTLQVLRNWAIVFLGNFVGALGTAALNFVAGQYMFGKGLVGVAALAAANSKCELEFPQALALGILCNTLVCLAVWLSFSARTTTDRVLCIVPPIAAFVAAGFEHSIANMYYVPFALLIKALAPASFWQAAGKAASDYPSVSMDAFLLHNLIPVTIGNIIGGALLVGVVYWFVYLRQVKAPKPDVPVADNK